MNPLSAWTYHRRHWGHTLLLFGLTCLVTLALYVVITLALVSTLGPVETENHYLQHFSTITPITGDELAATTLAHVRDHPAVSAVIPVSKLPISINTLAGNDTFELLALRQADIPTVLARSGVTVSSGRLIDPRRNELMLSHEIAANLGIAIGDQIGRTINRDSFSFIRQPLTVVGLLAGDTRLAIISYEYLANHELYRNRVNYGLLVTAKPGQEAVLEDFLVNSLDDAQVEVETLPLLLAVRGEIFQIISIVFGPVALLISLVLTVVTAVINRFELARRLSEFGILHVVGYSKGWLTRRLARETTMLALAGWSVGIVVPWLSLALLNYFVLAPSGYGFQPFQRIAFLLTMPMPVAVVLVVTWRLARTLARLDGIAIIERGELSEEVKPPRTKGSQQGVAQNSAYQPLSFQTYYRRHRGRALLLIGAMALMIMAVVALIFSLTTSLEAQLVYLGELKQLSALNPSTNLTLDSGVSSQVRSHPTVESVIPAIAFNHLSMTIPPFSTIGINAYAVSSEDMAHLVQLYDLQIKEGRLPNPRSNEVIIAEASALNRQLKVGDILGRADEPAYDGAPVLPAPLLITGIFARAQSQENENWLSLASLEFVQSHEGFAGAASHLFIVPKPGMKMALDDWLEREFAPDPAAESQLVDVSTYRQQLAQFQSMGRGILRVVAIVQGIVALVAALALAVLNYIFLSQRQAEFSLLYALGHGRRWLIWRTLRETIFTTTMAWVLSVLLCLIGLLYMKFGIFQPLGIALNLFDPTPWYFTLPVPIAVLLVSAATTNRLLRRLDPVAVIEKA